MSPLKDQDTGHILRLKNVCLLVIVHRFVHCYSRKANSSSFAKETKPRKIFDTCREITKTTTWHVTLHLYYIWSLIKSRHLTCCRGRYLAATVCEQGPSGCTARHSRWCSTKFCLQSTSTVYIYKVNRLHVYRIPLKL